MYIGLVRKVERRKPAKCAHCENQISVGASCFVVIRSAKSKRGKGYLWTVYVHTDCFLDWADRAVEKRKEYTADRKGGRPTGSALQQFTEDWPELAAERHQCIRTRARLMRYLLASEEHEHPKLHELVQRIKELDKRIHKILPMQVKQAGRRTAADRGRILGLIR